MIIQENLRKIFTRFIVISKRDFSASRWFRVRLCGARNWRDKRNYYARTNTSPGCTTTAGTNWVYELRQFFEYRGLFCLGSRERGPVKLRFAESLQLLGGSPLVIPANVRLYYPSCFSSEIGGSPKLTFPYVSHLIPLLRDSLIIYNKLQLPR